MAQQPPRLSKLRAPGPALVAVRPGILLDSRPGGPHPRVERPTRSHEPLAAGRCLNRARPRSLDGGTRMTAEESKRRGSAEGLVAPAEARPAPTAGQIRHWLVSYVA